MQINHKESKISGTKARCHCNGCGKEFFARTTELKRGRGKYCSIICRVQHQRKHYFDESYFLTIDNETKAYWLGFIVADGYLDLIDHERYNLLITLSGKDECHLKRFLRDINADPNDLHYYTGNVIRVKLSSKQIAFDIARIRGRGKDRVPISSILSNVPASFLSHFFRGLFDGDGSVCIMDAKHRYGRPYKRFQISLYGRLDACKAFSKFLGFEGENVYSTKRNCSVFLKHGALFVRRCYELLYTNATVYLERKRDIWLRFIDLHRNKDIQVDQDSNRFCREVAGATKSGFGR